MNSLRTTYFSNNLKGIKLWFGAFFLFYGFQLVFKLFFVLTTVKFEDIPFAFFQSIFFGFRLDISVTGYLLFFLFTFLLIYGVIKSETEFGLKCKFYVSRIYAFLFTLIIIAHGLVLIADILLFHYWQWRLNAQAISYLLHWRILLDTLPLNAWLGLILVVIVTVAVFLIVPKRIQTILTNTKLSFQRQYFMVIPILVVLARGGISEIPVNLGSALSTKPLEIQVASLNGIWNAFYSITMVKSTDQMKLLLMDEKQESTVYDLYKPNKYSNLQVLSKELKQFWLSNPHKIPDIHLIILEGINQHWLERRNSPFTQLKQLESDFLTFSRCYSIGDRTDKGLAALIGGWPGEPGPGILFSPDRWDRLTGLTELFQSNNYRSEFWYGGDINFANQGSFLQTMGFNEIFDKQSISKSSIINENVPKTKIYPRVNPTVIKWGYSDMFTASSMLKSNNDPYFEGKSSSVLSRKSPLFRTWLTLSTHEPFDIVLDRELKTDRQLFEASMGHLDSAISTYLLSIKSNPREWDNSLIIIVSDHGKVFGLEDMPWSESEFFRIPLWIGGGAVNQNLKGRKWESIVSQSDLYATLSYMLSNCNLEENQPWGRAMINFNGFQSALCFKGDYSLLIWGNQENLGHLEKPMVLSDKLDFNRRALQSKIIRKNFRF